MLFVELIVYLSTAIASLRAGSRLLYIIQHGEIGVMDGPLIMDPTNKNQTMVISTNSFDTDIVKQTSDSDLWKYSLAFRQAVTLSLNKQDGFTIAPKNNYGSIEQYKLDSPTKKYLMIRGLRLRLLNDLIKGAVKKSRPLWYHFCIDPLIIGILKWTSFPVTSRMKPQQQSSMEKHQNNNWNYDQIAESLIDDLQTIQSSNNTSLAVAKVKAYAPDVFDDLRNRFGIDLITFIRSILLSGPFVSFQSNSKGAMRSGGIFFFTRDGMFMIKTIKETELSSLQRMLPKYHRYMMRNAKKSLLTRFCGLYSVQLLNHKEKKEQYFIVMNSVFPVQGKSFITERFDIKGSTVGRYCSKEELDSKKTFAVLKDLDLTHSDEGCKYVNEKQADRKSNAPIVLGERMKASLLDQLRHDVGLLISCDVMDYSLLMGIVPLNQTLKTIENSSNFNDHSSSPSNLLRIITSPVFFLGGKVYKGGRRLISSILTVPFPYYGADICGVDCGKLSKIEGQRHGQPAIYYLGLIDFLQPWTFRKACEREIKGLVGYDKQLISCVHPRLYASRFLDFLDSNIC